MTRGPIERAETPEALFAAIRADDSARALVTFYDDATGERMELSAASLGNWIAKTHFLLTDEVGAGVGDRAFVATPLHWQRLVALFGAWSAGLEVTSNPTGPTGPSAEVAFVSVDHVAEASAVQDVYALALRPWGQGFADGPPPGTEDFVAAVRPQPDAWASVRAMAGPDVAAFDGASRAELMAAARELAADRGLTRGSRISIDEQSPYAQRPEALLAALTVTGSIVLVRSASADADLPTRRAAQEQITHQF